MSGLAGGRRTGVVTRRSCGGGATRCGTSRKPLIQGALLTGARRLSLLEAPWRSTVITGLGAAGVYAGGLHRCLACGFTLNTMFAPGLSLAIGILMR